LYDREELVAKYCGVTCSAEELADALRWHSRGKKRKKNKHRKHRDTYEYRGILLKELGFKDYSQYRNGPLWKELRNKQLARTPDCELCDIPAVCIHHMNYSHHVLTGEHWWKLVSLCEACHEDLEFDGKKKRTLKDVIHYTEERLKDAGVFMLHTNKGHPRE
jgi:hypothetical protein